MMDPGEICRNYCQAKDKKAQVKILAELNDCKKEEILEILKKGGVSWNQLPRSRKAPGEQLSKKNEVSTSKDFEVITEFDRCVVSLLKKMQKEISVPELFAFSKAVLYLSEAKRANLSEAGCNG